MDEYIDWNVPESGGGPAYSGMWNLSVLNCKLLLHNIMSIVKKLYNLEIYFDQCLFIPLTAGAVDFVALFKLSPLPYPLPLWFENFYKLTLKLKITLKAG